MVKGTKITKEDEALLLSFSNTAAVSSKSATTLFGVMAIAAVAPPLYLLYGINQMDLWENGIVIAIAAVVGIYALFFAYKEMTQNYKPKVERLREKAIAAELNREFGDDKKITKNEREERILFKKSEHAAKEAAYFSILYNNALFTVLCLAISFFLVPSFSASLNTLVSVAGAGGLVALFSTAK
ncbi:hypothetical protein QR680_004717 [Steinernema hermaphroditum]|uniref:Translocon-associated protein subunit gamma n=1 Tax=Steinernema hermaphroditum TaxID=289476 RepID=A0AA39LU50_9BILA|nr:hypothetical protein QR680_004717 [Steinernema hermaphroditum]